MNIFYTLKKKIIVESIRKYSKCSVCAVGDGINDVAMVNSADVGVGIVNDYENCIIGADFFIARFKDLVKLIIFDGNEVYLKLNRIFYFVLVNLLLTDIYYLFRNFKSFSIKIAFYVKFF